MYWPACGCSCWEAVGPAVFLLSTVVEEASPGHEQGEFPDKAGGVLGGLESSGWLLGPAGPQLCGRF